LIGGSVRAGAVVDVVLIAICLLFETAI
jgi:hypothetical protein